MSNEIKITITGSVSISAYKDDVEITITGELCNSGCQDDALIKAIGLDTIASTVDNDQLLSHIKVEDLVDHLINVSNLSDDEIKRIGQQFIDSVTIS